MANENIGKDQFANEEPINPSIAIRTKSNKPDSLNLLIILIMYQWNVK